MKNKFGREVLLLTLPVLVLAGVAVWKAKTGVTLSWNPSFGTDNSGPLRMQFSPFQPAEILPSRAYGGYDWAVKTDMHLAGNAGLPATIAKTNSIDLSSDFRLVYRKGRKWQTIPLYRTKLILLAMEISPKITGLTLNVDLDKVPRDAEEIRLRGAFVTDTSFNGVWPAKLKRPENLMVYPKVFIFKHEPKPFDVLVKGPDDAWPQPVVSHDPELQFVRAFHVADKQGKASIYVQLRRPNANAKGSNPSPGVVAYRLTDASGKKVDACNVSDGANYSPYYFSPVERGALAPNFPDTDVIIPVWSNVEPCKNQSGIKLPLTLCIEFGDAGKWPLKIRVPLAAKKYDPFNQYPFR